MPDRYGAPPERFPGTLILVAGPSGAGKDTLLRAAEARLAQDRFRVAQREITRPLNPDVEPFRSVSPAEFAVRKARGDYLLAWEAHGLFYGVPRRYERDLRAGRAVLANVSRGVLGEAAARFAPLRIVLVTTPPELLEQRLRARGREQEQDVRRRLARADYPLPIPAKDVIAFANVLPPAAAADAFVRLLEALPMTEAIAP